MTLLYWVMIGILLWAPADRQSAVGLQAAFQLPLFLWGVYTHIQSQVISLTCRKDSQFIALLRQVFTCWCVVRSSCSWVVIRRNFIPCVKIKRQRLILSFGMNSQNSLDPSWPTTFIKRSSGTSSFSILSWANKHGQSLVYALRWA